MEKTPGDIIILHMCTKKWLHDVRFLKYGARRTDERSEKVIYRGGCPTLKCEKMLNNVIVTKVYIRRLMVWELKFGLSFVCQSFLCLTLYCIKYTGIRFFLTYLFSRLRANKSLYGKIRFRENPNFGIRDSWLWRHTTEEPTDAVDGTTKNQVFNEIESSILSIPTPNEFSEGA